MAFGKKEKRAARRMARFGVVAHVEVHGEKIECLVNDVTTFGLRLIFPSRQRLPSQVGIILIPGTDARSAHVRWQRGTHVGVEFIR